MAQGEDSVGSELRSREVQTRPEGQDEGTPSNPYGTQRAACFGITSAFYGPYSDLREEPEAERKARESFCKDICDGCEIRWSCLKWALEEEEPFGIWGGVAQRERERFGKWLKKQGLQEIPEIANLEGFLDAFREFEISKRKKRGRKPKTAPVLPLAQVISIASARSRSRSITHGLRVSGLERGTSSATSALQDGADSSQRRTQAAPTRVAGAGSVPGIRGGTNRVAAPKGPSQRP